MGDVIDFKSKIKAANCMIQEQPDFRKLSYEQKAHLLCELGKLLEEIEKVKAQIEAETQPE